MHARLALPTMVALLVLAGCSGSPATEGPEATPPRPSGVAVAGSSAAPLEDLVIDLTTRDYSNEVLELAIIAETPLRVEAAVHMSFRKSGAYDDCAVLAVSPPADAAGPEGMPMKMVGGVAWRDGWDAVGMSAQAGGQSIQPPPVRESQDGTPVVRDENGTILLAPGQAAIVHLGGSSPAMVRQPHRDGTPAVFRVDLSFDGQGRVEDRGSRPLKCGQGFEAIPGQVELSHDQFFATIRNGALRFDTKEQSTLLLWVPDRLGTESEDARVLFVDKTRPTLDANPVLRLSAPTAGTIGLEITEWTVAISDPPRWFVADLYWPKAPTLVGFVIGG